MAGFPNNHSVPMTSLVYAVFRDFPVFQAAAQSSMETAKYTASASQLAWQLRGMIMTKTAFRGAAILVSLTLLLHPQTGAGVELCPDPCLWQVTSLRHYEMKGELEVPSEMANENYKILTMIGADIEIVQPMRFPCGNEVTTTTQEIGENRWSFSLLVQVRRPECSGNVYVCAGPEDFFRKRKYRSWKQMTCYRPFRNVMGPNEEIIETFGMGIQALYMTKENYRELRETDSTHIFVPVLQWFRIDVYAFRNPLDQGFWYCQIKKPNRKDYGVYQLFQQKVKLNIIPSLANSGEYDLRCRGLYYYLPEHVWLAEYQEKKLKITFFQGILLKIPGHPGKKIVFSSSETSASFIVEVCTTSPVEVLQVRRSDGLLQEQQVLVTFLSYEEDTVIAKYRIGLPWIAENTAGTYTISATNSDGVSATTTIEIIKAQALSVLVSPAVQIVGAGATVSFECLVLGKPATNITWARDFKDLKPEEDGIEVTEMQGEQRGLKLTFLSPRLPDSGDYVCSASNQFETVKGTVELAVFPPGSPYIDPNYQAPLGDDRELDTSEELLEEWASSAGQSSSGAIAAAIAGTFLGVALLAVCIVAACYIRQVYRKYQEQKSGNTGKGAALRPRAEYIPLSQESRLQLIPNTFRSHSEEDLIKEWGLDVDDSNGDGSDDEGFNGDGSKGDNSKNDGFNGDNSIDDCDENHQELGLDLGDIVKDLGNEEFGDTEDAEQDIDGEAEEDLDGDSRKKTDRKTRKKDRRAKSKSSKDEDKRKSKARPKDRKSKSDKEAKQMSTQDRKREGDGDDERKPRRKGQGKLRDSKTIDRKEGTGESKGAK